MTLGGLLDFSEFFPGGGFRTIVEAARLWADVYVNVRINAYVHIDLHMCTRLCVYIEVGTYSSLTLSLQSCSVSLVTFDHSFNE